MGRLRCLFPGGLVVGLRIFPLCVKAVRYSGLLLDTCVSFFTAFIFLSGAIFKFILYGKLAADDGGYLPATGDHHRAGILHFIDDQHCFSSLGRTFPPHP